MSVRGEVAGLVAFCLLLDLVINLYNLLECALHSHEFPPVCITSIAGNKGCRGVHGCRHRRGNDEDILQFPARMGCVHPLKKKFQEKDFWTASAGVGRNASDCWHSMSEFFLIVWFWKNPADTNSIDRIFLFTQLIKWNYWIITFWIFAGSINDCLQTYTHPAGSASRSRDCFSMWAWLHFELLFAEQTDHWV